MGKSFPISIDFYINFALSFLFVEQTFHFPFQTLHVELDQDQLLNHGPSSFGAGPENDARGRDAVSHETYALHHERLKKMA